MDSADVSVKCRNCGNEAKAGQFVLSSDHGIMVCPDCMRKKDVKKEPEAKEPVKEAKPEGWDAEDEALEKAHKRKQAMQKPKLEIGMKLKCKKCKYDFVYNGRRDCPFCSASF